MSELVVLDINGEPVQFERGCTVGDVVAALGCGARGVAVAVNSQLVIRSQWPTVELADGDNVEILHAVAGG